MLSNLAEIIVGMLAFGFIYYFILTKYKDVSKEKGRKQSIILALMWGAIYFVIGLLF